VPEVKIIRAGSSGPVSAGTKSGDAAATSAAKSSVSGHAADAMTDCRSGKSSPAASSFALPLSSRTMAFAPERSSR
jgi:hypothetical protein